MASSIWEKKYGHNANHAKKQREEMLVAGAKRDQFRAARRAHEDPNQSRPGARRGKPADRTTQQHHQQADMGWAQRTQPTVAIGHPLTRRLKEEQPLHPSWEAKKKLKEKQAAGIVPSQGTKIKF